MTCLMEELPMNFLMYLNANDLITLCYVSKFWRYIILTKFATIYRISTGFCSVEHWSNLIEKNCFSLIESIHNDSFFDETFFNYHFDFEEYYFKLMERYRHLPLFSVCLHFLRCVRSCDIKSNYCRSCSRVCGKTFYECNAFQIWVYVYLNLI